MNENIVQTDRQICLLDSCAYLQVMITLCLDNGGVLRPVLLHPGLRQQEHSPSHAESFWRILYFAADFLVDFLFKISIQCVGKNVDFNF